MLERQTIKSLSHSNEHRHISELLTQRGKLLLASGFQLYLRKKSPKYKIKNPGNKQHSSRNLSSREYLLRFLFHHSQDSKLLASQVFRGPSPGYWQTRKQGTGSVLPFNLILTPPLPYAYPMLYHNCTTT